MTNTHESGYISLKSFRALVEPYDHDAYLEPDCQPFFDLIEHSMAAVPYYSPAHFNQYARILAECAAAKGVAPDYFARKITELYKNIVLQGDYTNKISNCIEQILQNDNSCDHLSILPILCGAGKSTAISYLIKRILEQPDHDGILIVTDRKDRMDEYTEPSQDRDPELFDYLQSHKYKIVTLKMGEDLPKLFAAAKNVPVVIMTTQRYFNMEKEEIKSLLTWGDGKHRLLILFDESPILTERISISRPLLNEIATAISERIPYCADTQDEKQFCIQYWEKFREDMYHVICEHDSLLPDPEYFSPYTFPRQELNDDDCRFIRFIKQNKEHLRFSKRNDEEQDPRVEIADYARIILNVFRLFPEKCIRYTAHSGSWYKNTITAVVDNREKLADLDAKVIILDGTGLINPDYNQAIDKFQNARKYDRSLDNLSIHFINTPAANKDSMNIPAHAGYVGKATAKYISEIHPDVPCAAFTYKAAENAIRDSFSEVEHFGNLKGKNTFRDYQLLAQIGLHRFDNEYYIAQTLYHHPEFFSRLSSDVSSSEISMWCNSVKSSPEYTEVVNKHLIVDLVQNIFRSRIRMPDCIEPIHYYVFCNTIHNSSLIQAITEQFGVNGPQIITIHNPTMMNHFIEAERPQEENSMEARIRKWINSLPPNTLFTTKTRVRSGLSVRNMLKELEITYDQFKWLKGRSPSFMRYIQSLSTDKKGYFCNSTTHA